jgi:hypothetical protein
MAKENRPAQREAELLKDINKQTCANCGKPKADHFGLRHACPLSRTVKPGSRFKALEQ